MKRILAALAVLLLIASPVTAENISPRQEFLDAQAMIQADFGAASSVNDAVNAGTASMQDLRDSLKRFRDDLADVNVDDCFALWWSDYMASLQLMVMAMDDAILQNGFTTDDSSLVTAAAALVNKAKEDIDTVTCVIDATDPNAG